MLRHGSLVRTVLEGGLPGKKRRGRPEEMLQSWLLETSDDHMDYSQLKERTTDDVHGEREPARRAEYNSSRLISRSVESFKTSSNCR